MNACPDVYSNFYKGVNRYEAAMRGIPDRVPVYAQLHDFARKECGANTKDFYSDPEVLVNNTLETLKRWHIDYPTIDYDVYNIEAEALGQKIIYHHNNIPAVDRTQPLIQSKQDLDKIRTPNFTKDGRFCMYFCNIDSATPAENFKTAIETIHQFGNY